MDSILSSIKKLLGIEEDYTHFDIDIIMHINSVFTILQQLGLGPYGGFSIEDKSATWNDFLQDKKNIELVKSYMHMKVKMLFDPPQAGTLTEALERRISEAEWRLNIQAERGDKYD